MDGKMNPKDYSRLSMDEIVFDERNKKYGAFWLRQQYTKTLIKAITASVIVFVLAMFTPDILKKMGFFKPKKKPKVEISTTVVNIPEPPPTKEEETPPPPPPEQKIERPTVQFLTMVAKKDEEVKDEEPPDLDTTGNRDAGTTTSRTAGPDTVVVFKEPEKSGPPAREIFRKVEQDAEFKGDLGEFIGEHLQYPEREQEMGHQGTCLIEFVVDENGKVETNNIKVLSSSGYPALDSEAKRVIAKLSTPGFRPAKQRGNPVPVYFKIPISFTLDEDE